MAGCWQAYGRRMADGWQMGGKRVASGWQKRAPGSDFVKDWDDRTGGAGTRSGAFAGRVRGWGRRVACGIVAPFFAFVAEAARFKRAKAAPRAVPGRGAE